MTYNTHACRGRDGKVEEERIAAVIAEVSPDVVALQEVDQNRRRSRFLDQALELARPLGMGHHFSPARRWRVGAYGNAVLSRFPFTMDKEGCLPRPRGLPLETRGAQLVTIELPGGNHLHVINTHLGLLRFERIRQVRALLGPDWLGRTRHPVILCGDLNARPKSPEISLLAPRLTGATPLEPTFPVHFPLVKLDYLCYSPELGLQRSFVHRSALAGRASDHYPLVADFTLDEP